MIAPAGGPVHIVNVSKTRTRYNVQGCVSEVTDVVANGSKVRTVAIEDARRGQGHRGRSRHGARPAIETSATLAA